MTDDILDVRLVPAWDFPSIRASLCHSLSSAELLQAAVAYWTVDEGLFGKQLTKRIASPSGFLCVDLHMPTDIDALADLVKAGSDVRIFCEDITTYRRDGKKEPPFLLHTKMLLFWSKDRSAELWVGSHNWTNRALLGLNIESSMVVRLKDSSRLFHEAAEYLGKIKSICEPFDLSRIDFYKELQKNIDERTVPVIEVEATGADGLAGHEISIFGTDDEDLKELGTIRRKVYLSATESSGDEKEYIYPARITGASELNSANPLAGKIGFSPRRYAFRYGRRFPELLPTMAVSSDVLNNARYYVSLELEPPTNVSFDYPRGRIATWEVTEDDRSPLMRRIGMEDFSLMFRNREPRVKIPVESEGVMSKAMTLYERRNLMERSFVTRRVVRRG